MSPRSECRGARTSRRRLRLPVRAELGQPGQDRRRGASEHHPQLSMMDLELPPPGLPSQQVLPQPSASHCSTETGAGARGSCGPGGTAATGISPSVAGARSGAAAFAPGRGGTGWRSRDPRGREGSGGAPGWSHRQGARRPRGRLGGGLEDILACVGRVASHSLVASQVARSERRSPIRPPVFERLPRLRGRRGWTLAV